MPDLAPTPVSQIQRPRIALCLEYPLRYQGGVSVLVKELQRGLVDKFEVVIVSPDREGVAGSEHVFWDPVLVSRETSVALAERLVAMDVRIAHFHMGGNYGWGNRLPNRSPIVHAAKRGIAVLATSHLVVDIFAGYCGPERAFWFKLCMLPLAWCGKMQALWHSRVEIAVSRHDASKLRRWYAPLSHRFRMLYHSCMDPSAMPGTSEERDRIILAVGHIAFRKGQQVLAAAFARVAGKYPDWNLWLAGPVGEEGCRAAIAEIAKREGLTSRIQFLGPREDVWALMQRAGLFVQPSRQEALGLALQEALYCGCPAIGTRVGGIPELIDENLNGVLVPPDDPAAMAEALDGLLGDAGRRTGYASSARASIERKGMTRAHMLDVHAEIYQSMLHGS